ncbi:DUF4097 family beta strand repeat-containing protein [Actinosynnema sp. NPDC023587]|uniref:DUF4097 family beta strand repeat-containing protein n=1 Tax=Actinosynnema sp. NPDC023587 TaxID=3154695 RepID=UPI0033C25FCD
MPEGAVVVKRIALVSVAVVLVAGALSSCVRLVQNNFSDTSDITEKITSVRVQNGAGDVSVRGAEGTNATRVVRKVDYPKDSDKPTGTTHRMEGGVLVLDGCGNQCTVSYEVTVPTKDVAVVGDNSSGDVTLEDVASVEISLGSGNGTLRKVSGTVRVDNNSGDVVASDVAGEFTGKFGSGNARLTRLSGPVLVDGDSGDIEVELAAPRSVRATAGSGNLTVQVPRGAYKLDADSGSGDKNLGDVKDDPTATVELVLRTKSGDLTLRAA